MSTKRNNLSRCRAGYTLVEVLVIVTIMGIAAAVVVPQMLSAGTLGVQAAARIIIADILYAQNDAIAQQRNRRVIFDPDTESYSLVDENGAVLTARWISGAANNYIVDFTSDSRFAGVVIVSADFGGATPKVLEFDALGGPLNGGTVEIEFNDQRYRITVASFTGRVTVQQI
ncbi:MAG: prepilin-type N-terminal cleavage/methylation domain-containing protein [Phycisphaerales bacterium]